MNMSVAQYLYDVACEQNGFHKNSGFKFEGIDIQVFGVRNLTATLAVSDIFLVSLEEWKER
jgi:hypothetical protein